MSEFAEDSAIDRLNRLSAAWDRVDAVTASNLPPVEYFEEHAPYLDLRPMKAFLWASIHLTDLLDEAKSNAGRLAWDSSYAEEVFEKIHDAGERITKTKHGINRYTDLWVRMEICREFVAEQAEKQAAETIMRAKNGTPFSPV